MATSKPKTIHPPLKVTPRRTSKMSNAVEPEDMPLNDKEAAFVRAYTTGPTEGNTFKSAESIGVQGRRGYVYMGMPNVVKAIELARGRIRAEAEAQASISLAGVVQQLAKLAMFDVRKLWDDNGNLKLPKDWPDDIAAAVAGVDVFEEFQGPEQEHIGNTKKVKLLDRTKALDMLMKHLGGYEKDNKQQGAAGADAIAELAKAIQGVQGDGCRLPIAPAS